MTYLTIFLLILENTSRCLWIAAEAYASAELLLEKISTQETSENSDLILTTHTNFRISTFLKDFQTSEEPFPHSSPTIIPKHVRGVKTNLHLLRFFFVFSRQVRWASSFFSQSLMKASWVLILPSSFPLRATSNASKVEARDSS